MGFVLTLPNDGPDVKGEDIRYVINQGEVEDTRENALPIYAAPPLNLALKFHLILKLKVHVHVPELHCKQGSLGHHLYRSIRVHYHGLLMLVLFLLLLYFDVPWQRFDQPSLHVPLTQLK